MENEESMSFMPDVNATFARMFAEQHVPRHWQLMLFDLPEPEKVLLGYVENGGWLYDEAQIKVLKLKNAEKIILALAEHFFPDSFCFHSNNVVLIVFDIMIYSSGVFIVCISGRCKNFF